MTEESEAKTAEETAATEAAATEAKTAEEAAAAEATGEVDYEKRYKDLQAEQTRTSQENAELRQRNEQLEQPPETPPEEADLGDEEGFVDRKTVNQIVSKAVSQAVATVRTQAADAYFRKTYPDLVKHEGIIAGIMRNPKDLPKKGASAEERIDAAVKEFNNLTEEAITSAKAEAEQAAKDREEANRKASGLTSSSTTSPKGGEEEPSDAQELADRKAKSAKQRGLA